MEKEKHRVALWSVLAAFLLTGSKLAIGILTGSLGILSEALHSGLDLVAAVITYFSVRISDKPADKNHHFGHGKVENFSAFLETVLLLLTCVWIIYEGVSRLVSGKTHIEVNSWSYVVVIGSIVVDYSRSRALYRVARKYNSQALEADALHFSTDIWSSIVVLLGLICAGFDLFIADSIAALIVALIVIGVSMRLGRRSIKVLLDGAPENVMEPLQKILDETDGVLYYHDLKIRASGAEVFVELTIHVDAGLSIGEAHEISNQLEQKFRNTLGRSHIHIHTEPDEKSEGRDHGPSV